MTPWWQTPQMIGGMWLVISGLGTVIWFFFRSWQTDREKISDLNKEITEIKTMLRGLDNGTSLAVVVSRVNDIHEWYMGQIKGGRKR